MVEISSFGGEQQQEALSRSESMYSPSRNQAIAMIDWERCDVDPFGSWFFLPRSISMHPCTFFTELSSCFHLSRYIHTHRIVQLHRYMFSVFHFFVKSSFCVSRHGCGSSLMSTRRCPNRENALISITSINVWSNLKKF
jgi:hypothetical protein